MFACPAGRFWSFCFWAAVLGVMTLNPEATSMLSLFCVVVCVLAQLINSAAQPALILLRKKRVVCFIDSDLPCYRIRRSFAIPAWKKGKTKGEVEKTVFLSCVPGFLIRFSVSRTWFLIHRSYFSLFQILHLPRTGFAAVIRPLFNQFLRRHSVKGN